MKVAKAKQILDKVHAEKNYKKNKKIYDFIVILENILEDFKHELTALPYERFVELVVEKPVTNPFLKLFKKTTQTTLTVIYPSYGYAEVEVIGLKYAVENSYNFCALSREEDVAEFVMYIADKLNV